VPEKDATLWKKSKNFGAEVGKAHLTKKKKFAQQMKVVFSTAANKGYYRSAIDGS